MPKCIYLNSEGLCDIYENRPQCCRNFPNRNHPNCIDDSRCNLNCKECKDKCCENVLLTHNGFIESLSIKCVVLSLRA